MKINCILGKARNECFCEIDSGECRKCSWNASEDKRLTQNLRKYGLQKDAKGLWRIKA